MKALLEKIKKLKNKKIIILLILALIFLILAINYRTIIETIQQLTKPEVVTELQWKTRELSGNSGKKAFVLVTFRNELGIEKIKYTTEDGQPHTISSYGKHKVSLDYEMEDLKSYEFTLEFDDGTSKTYTIDYELPRIKGNYTLVGNTYSNEPDLTGYVKEKTRYLYLNDNGNLVPGNWIQDAAPAEWYNYEEQKWANIYVEVNGIDNYFVWIPRYVYKLNQTTQRSDIKFVNTYNEYIDSAGNKLTWAELQAQGYQLPEAFTWQYEDTNVPLILDGYWLSKYQLSELSSYKINYNLTASKTAFNVNTFTNNVSSIATSYTYAINGQIVNTSATLDDYSFTNTTPDQTNYINVTALDSEGRIVGSMTKELELTEVNAPDLTGFDKDLTFYVYWDENGNEHNEIPISMDPPEDWYNYSYSSWANIVVRNENSENYYVWIPRYQYNLDQTSQRSNVRFITGTGTETYAGYSIPEAFTWTNQAGATVQLPGYWLSKYQLTDVAATTKVKAEMATSNTAIKVKDITGNIITNATTNSININYEYYINGTKVHEGTSPTENYVYRNLEENKEYTINIILRNADTNAYLGAFTKKVTTIGENAPVLTGYDETRTYYVLYDDDGSARVGDLIKQDGSNMPENWYSYIDSKWANIVVTDGTIVDGQITGATQTLYFTWIPRYQYSLNQTTQRSDVRFIKGIGTETDAGYQIPEAFTWTNQAGATVQLPGYWLSKYQLSN